MARYRRVDAGPWLLLTDLESQRVPGTFAIPAMWTAVSPPQKDRQRSKKQGNNSVTRGAW